MGLIDLPESNYILGDCNLSGKQFLWNCFHAYVLNKIDLEHETKILGYTNPS